MDYMQSDLSKRFARNYATAAFGYARAASAAYSALADQTLTFWSNAARMGTQTERERPAPRLELVTGPRPYRSAYLAPAVVPASATAAPVDFVRISNAWMASPMFAPMRAWWSLFPFDSNPTSWPMAYAMMSAGVPRAVAVPAAEANVAAMQAADAATDSIKRVFSSYRSESGFAVAPILTPKTWMSAMMVAPFAPSFKFPWH